MTSAAVTPPMSSTPGVHRIKRKPVPSIDVAALLDLPPLSDSPTPTPRRQKRASLPVPVPRDVWSIIPPSDDKVGLGMSSRGANASSPIVAFELQPSPPPECMMSFRKEPDVSACSRPTSPPHYRKRSNTFGLDAPASPLPSITSHLTAKGSPSPSGSAWRLFTPPSGVSRQSSSSSASSGTSHHYSASTPSANLHPVDEDGTESDVSLRTPPRVPDAQSNKMKFSRLFFLSKRRPESISHSTSADSMKHARLRKSSISLPVSVELPPGAPQNLIPIAEVKQRAVSTPLVLSTPTPQRSTEGSITPISEDGTSMFDSTESQSTPPSSVHTRSNSSASCSDKASRSGDRTPRLAQDEDTIDTPRATRDDSQHIASGSDLPIDPNLLQPDLLERLSSLPLHSSSGKCVAFGAILNGAASPDRARITIVLFLRHFWCPLDQEYVSKVRTSLERLDDAPLIGKPEHDVDLVLVNTGAHSLIAKYMRVLGFPEGHVYGAGRRVSVRVHMYTDEARFVYSTLGMREATETRVGDVPRVRKDKKTGLVGFVLRALRGSSSSAKSGEVNQLGGQFVFDTTTEGSLRCKYAHRMGNTRDHLPFADLLKAAGVDLAADSRDQPDARPGSRARSLSFDGAQKKEAVVQHAVTFGVTSGAAANDHKPSPDTIKERKKRYRHSVSWGGNLSSAIGTFD
ncbi:hypothetical protein EV715DRAFT_244841 [Schizophyllum commune]